MRRRRLRFRSIPDGGQVAVTCVTTQQSVYKVFGVVVTEDQQPMPPLSALATEPSSAQSASRAALKLESRHDVAPHWQAVAEPSKSLGTPAAPHPTPIPNAARARADECHPTSASGVGAEFTALHRAKLSRIQGTPRYPGGHCDPASGRWPQPPQYRLLGLGDRRRRVHRVSLPQPRHVRRSPPALLN
jgi:hypothetical protein